MKCTICKKESGDVQLHTGILESDMVMVCEECAEDQGIPVIKRPSDLQLDKADKRYSVRERMEQMSGMRDASEISGEQMVVQGNLARLRVPPKKQYHEAVVDNYYWELNIARRRYKMTVNQLARKMGVSPEVIQGIEKGELPGDFEELFARLEIYLGAKLLKSHKTKVNFIRTSEDQEKILEDVKRKINGLDSDTPEEREAKFDKVEKGEIDFSKRDAIEDMTLNDLVEMKKRKEARDVKKKEDAMMGDDLDLDDKL
jgi:ribosome-binding protein aMBF1 (putative translation factor)